jgi:hypothetical protein
MQAVGEQGSTTVQFDELGEFHVALPSSSFLHLTLVSATRHTVIDLTPFLDGDSTAS